MQSTRHDVPNVELDDDGLFSSLNLTQRVKRFLIKLNKELLYLIKLEEMLGNKQRDKDAM